MDKPKRPAGKRYWLMKSEPTTFSIDDLANAPDQTTYWDGVRNYQARNLLRDDIHVGDEVLFYHSACAEPAVVGTATVVRAGYPDFTAWDPNSDHPDEKSTPENPRWYMVDIKLKEKLTRAVTLSELRTHPALEELALLRKGSRLSVQPVAANHFTYIVKLAKKKA
jgi:predicted RNA-binding protein with PUA-like domain